MCSPLHCSLGIAFRSGPRAKRGMGGSAVLLKKFVKGTRAASGCGAAPAGIAPFRD